MKLRSRSVRPVLELLEGREVPANLTATFSGSTLTVIGDNNDNDVTFQGDAGDKTHFTLISSGTINNLPSPFDSPSGVKNIVVKMLDGVDVVVFGNAVAIDLLGNLKIDGGNGANSLSTNSLTVEKNFSITNGTNSTGTDTSSLVNLIVGGSLTIKNGDGDSSTTIQRASTGASTIKHNLTMTNGAGQDEFFLTDTNVKGNVTINDGHASAGGTAGEVIVSNTANRAFPSVIGGNLSVTYLDGNVFNFDAIRDAEVMGSVTLRHGPGQFETQIDNFSTSGPVIIHGNLSILGTGTNAVKIGKGVIFGGGAGLVVGKKFTVSSGSGNDTVILNNLRVGRDTNFNLGDGGNNININNSEFAGRFTLITGGGNDTFNVEMDTGTSSATEFDKAVIVSLGLGSDSGNVAFAHVDAFQAVVVWSTFVVTGVETWNLDASQVFFPNGNQIQV